MKNSPFLRAYVECALWSTNDEDDNPLDAVFSIDDIDPKTLHGMRDDCADFIWANRADLRKYCESMHSGQWPGMTRAGHDFWLTRNGHGAGFWDRGLGALGNRLSNSAQVYGDVYLWADMMGVVRSC